MFPPKHPQRYRDYHINRDALGDIFPITGIQAFSRLAQAQTPAMSNLATSTLHSHQRCILGHIELVIFSFLGHQLIMCAFSRIVPLSTYMMQEEFLIVERRCAMMKEVRPFSSSFKPFCRMISVSVSMLEVASSRIRIFGSAKCAGKGDQLALSGGQTASPFIYLCLITVFHFHDEVMGADRFCSRMTSSSVALKLP